MNEIQKEKKNSSRINDNKDLAEHLIRMEFANHNSKCNHGQHIEAVKDKNEEKKKP